MKAFFWDTVYVEWSAFIKTNQNSKFYPAIVEKAKKLKMTIIILETDGVNIACMDAWYLSITYVLYLECNFESKGIYKSY